MFGFIFRVVGLFILALALVLAVLDITRSITASELVMTPLASTWAAFSENSLSDAQVAIETLAGKFIWDPVIVSVLKLPSWAVFWLLAMVLLKLGQKRPNPYGRFASR